MVTLMTWEKAELLRSNTIFKEKKIITNRIAGSLFILTEKSRQYVISNGCGGAQGVSGPIVLTTELFKGNENSEANPQACNTFSETETTKTSLGFCVISSTILDNVSIDLESNIDREDVSGDAQPL